MLYFAYASNLDPELMQHHAASARVVGLAAMREHRLAFPRFSEDWGGGLACPQLAHGQTVWGVVYDVTEEDLAGLDAKEGYVAPGDHHNVCDRDTTTVDLTRPDDGSIPRRVRPWIYLPRTANPSPPSRRYLETILRGARHHRLPEEYVARLAQVEVAAES